MIKLINNLFVIIVRNLEINL